MGYYTMRLKRHQEFHKIINMIQFLVGASSSKSLSKKKEEDTGVLLFVGYLYSNGY